MVRTVKWWHSTSTREWISTRQPWPGRSPAECGDRPTPGFPVCSGCHLPTSVSSGAPHITAFRGGDLWDRNGYGASNWRWDALRDMGLTLEAKRCERDLQLSLRRAYNIDLRAHMTSFKRLTVFESN